MGGFEKGLVSVLIPAYNAEEYIADALRSILLQTYKEIEVILINDGSTDSTANVLKRFSDSRLRIIENSKNLGLATVRNQALREAKGRYVAWLDADDFSLPDRLMRQIKCFEKNVRLAICGSWIRYFGSERGVWKYPTQPNRIHVRFLLDDPLATSSIMLDRTRLPKEELYFNPAYPPAEDYELWARIVTAENAYNLSKPLTHYRLHASQSSQAKREHQKRMAWEVQRRLLARLGIRFSDQEKNLYLRIGLAWNFSCTINEIFIIDNSLFQVYESNKKLNIYNESHLLFLFAFRILKVCLKSNKNFALGLRLYHETKIGKCMPLNSLSFLRQIVL